MNRLQAIKYTLAHRKVLNKMAIEKGYYYPFHDLDKIFFYILFGKKITHSIHRAYSKHHEYVRDYFHGKPVLDIRDKYQAAFDWESCRFTKKDKQMTAYEYWIKACPEVDMYDVMKDLGFLPKKKETEIFSEIRKAIINKYK